MDEENKAAAIEAAHDMGHTLIRIQNDLNMIKDQIQTICIKCEIPKGVILHKESTEDFKKRIKHRAVNLTDASDQLNLSKDAQRTRNEILTQLYAEVEFSEMTTESRWSINRLYVKLYNFTEANGAKNGGI